MLLRRTELDVLAIVERGDTELCLGIPHNGIQIEQTDVITL